MRPFNPHHPYIRFLSATSATRPVNIDRNAFFKAQHNPSVADNKSAWKARRYWFVADVADKLPR
jgi:hypothetical protein